MKLFRLMWRHRRLRGIANGRLIEFICTRRSHAWNAENLRLTPPSTQSAFHPVPPFPKTCLSLVCHSLSWRVRERCSAVLQWKWSDLTSTRRQRWVTSRLCASVTSTPTTPMRWRLRAKGEWGPCSNHINTRTTLADVLVNAAAIRRTCRKSRAKPSKHVKYKQNKYQLFAVILATMIESWWRSCFHRELVEALQHDGDVIDPSAFAKCCKLISFRGKRHSYWLTNSNCSGTSLSSTLNLFKITQLRFE